MAKSQATIIQVFEFEWETMKNQDKHNTVLRALPSAKLCKFISGTFSKTEQNYPIHELEVLAIVRTLEKWKIELLPRKEFTVLTDSQYAAGFYRYKLEANRNQGRLVRWQLKLHQYSFVIGLIKSEYNTIADLLSREWRE